MQNRRRDITVSGVVAILFGLLTIFAGGRMLLGGAAAQAAGDAVPMVLWFNFGAGFVYVAAGIGLILRRRLAVRLTIMILVATALVMIAFGVHIALGGAFEMRTVWAMSLRVLVWGLIAGVVIQEPADFTLKSGNY